MSGLSETADALKSVLWPDAEILRVEIDYGNLHLSIRESTGKKRRLIFEGYLGYELVGFWDEVVVEQAELSRNGAFLDRCRASILRRIGATPFASGCDARGLQHALQLVVTLGDGCQLCIAFNAIQVQDLV